jgi:glycosyltransferase involved in cell wall biosynthesis
MKSEAFDIVHSSLFFANYHSTLAGTLAKIPLIITEEHGEHSFHLKTRYWFHRLIGRLIARLSDVILCCSDAMKKDIQRLYHVPEIKIKVIKNMVEDETLHVSRSRKTIRHELQLPEQATVLGTVSSLSRIKNQRLLIDLLYRFKEKELFLVFVGDGPLKEELKKYAISLDISSKVRFTGWRDDVANILNSLDVFILPSISEGMPISLLEAMSMGLPCIATRVGGIEELLSDGVTGKLVEVNNHGELANALAWVLDNRGEAEKLGLAARQHVIQNFKSSSYVNKVIKLYENSKKKKTMMVN